MTYHEGQSQAKTGFPKTPRIKDKDAIEKARKDYCEVCYGRFGLQVHHINAVGYAQKGSDTANNLICLCFVCHRKVHDGNISKEKLIEIVEGRKGI